MCDVQQIYTGLGFDNIYLLVYLLFLHLYYLYNDIYFILRV